ncbi:FAD-dependent oxidoreductase [Gordonia soli]|uniref:Thiamine biosynthesis oxidoreductase ThiO n=1 Tax=Gordonia soli NBRC 108243 TaxID=1223545 RepID=M0QFY9_9ACTN|nr:FAD-dependent oxidoreductase [Gordonia soli]GAC67535.1 thiamine biosynthesis oxidoreductase ThiO [Gordonia soli NBRC 108243]
MTPGSEASTREVPRAFPADDRRLSVVGGGVIGLTCALAAADAGWRVTVHDAGTDRRASWVAGGMLGSLGEGQPGEEAALAVSVESVRRWPALLDRLGDPSVAVARDSLFVAATSADAEYLDHLARFVWARQPRAGDELQAVDARGVRTRESALSSHVHGGYLAGGEGAIDNRKLLTRLRSALVEAGGRMVDERVSDLDAVDADQVLLATGLGTSALWPDAPLHAARGEILRLTRTRWSVPPPASVIRARWHGRAVYLVPREDGIVVGATQYEPTERVVAPEAGGVADLLADATDLMPGLRTYTLSEVGVGERPCSPDGLPVIRRLDDRTVVATGHGRNGIVLAPFTADAVVDLLAGNGDAATEPGSPTGSARLTEPAHLAETAQLMEPEQPQPAISSRGRGAR